MKINRKNNLKKKIILCTERTFQNNCDKYPQRWEKVLYPWNKNKEFF